MWRTHALKKRIYGWRPPATRQKWGMATNENQKDKKKTTKLAPFAKRITMLPTNTGSGCLID